jgi:hypothetical protein
MGKKMQLCSRVAASACVLLLLVSYAPAASSADASDQLTAYFGAFNLVRGSDASGHFGLEYRIPRAEFWHLKPWVGVLSTSDEAFWGGAGLYYDWQVTARTSLVPSFGAGFYEDGIGIDLGHTVEFRSQLGFSYRFDSQARIGISFGHLSNAGLADTNKGTEYLNVSYSLPMGRRRPGSPVNAARAAATGRHPE